MRECDESPPLLLREGIAPFNRGEYFEQREVRRLYQGILQIGVAFHHLRRRNYHGTVYMLTRGTRYLTPFSPRCQGVDVERLVIDATTALSAVEQLGPDRLGDLRLGTRADDPPGLLTELSESQRIPKLVESSSTQVERAASGSSLPGRSAPRAGALSSPMLSLRATEATAASGRDIWLNGGVPRESADRWLDTPEVGDSPSATRCAS